MPLSPDRDRRIMRSPGPRGRPPGGGYGGGGSRGGPPPMGYKVLCVSSLHGKASDDVVRDTLYREYKKYGDISVRVMQEPDERVAYVYFRNFEDARDAKNSRSRIILFDKPAMVEPVYESRSGSSEYRDRGRPRSITPPPSGYHPRYRSRSPINDRGDRYHRDYRDDYHRGSDYYHRDSGHRHMGGGRGGRGGYMDYGGSGGGGGGGGSYHGERKRDYKKDKFPNYLDHKPPEDDPLATRTLFTGNLELNITEDEIRRIFGRYGKLVDIDIKRPPPGTGNAYAFIRYENLDQAHRAKLELSGQYIGKFQCKIGYGKVNATPKVWIGGLGSWTTESLLEREFDRFGVIKKIEYHKGDQQAFIFYATLEAAQAAVQEMRGFPLGGPDKRIRIDYSDIEDYTGPLHGARPRDEYEDYRGSSRGRYPSRGGGRGSYGGRDEWSGPGKRDYDDRMSRGSRGDPGSPYRNRSNSPPGNALHDAKNVSDISHATFKCWEGGLILKSNFFPAKLHQIEGSSRISDNLKDENGQAFMKISQRLRLDQSKLDDVRRRMNASSSHGIFLCMPTANTIENDNAEIQPRPLRNLVSYLKQKEAAGVISMPSDDDPNLSQVLYCFPPCPFSADLLKRESPFFEAEEGKDDHLVILVVCGNAN